MEKIELNFKLKAYHFSLALKEGEGNLYWKKSGFKVKRGYKLKGCWRNTVEREVIKIRNFISSKADSKLLGESADFTWNSRTVEKSLLPKEMDQLDKRFTHLFNVLKTGEGKCIK
ncbi:MAG: hypothetical protein ACJAT2_001877 [Bacteriovoracaceae bacterium]|jgi:hypothetical protein